MIELETTKLVNNQYFPILSQRLNRGRMFNKKEMNSVSNAFSPSSTIAVMDI